MTERICWGMIGCGDVTEVKNGPGLYLAENSYLKGVWNRTREKAESWTKRHETGIVYDSLDALLSDPEIDIIYIATTPDTHKDLAIRVARAGKHALLEKPVAATYEDGVKILEAFQKASKKCFVCFYRRTMNRFIRLNEIIQNGEIGEIQGIQMLRCVSDLVDTENWRTDPNVCCGDVFTETDIHALDIMEMIMGHIDSFQYTKDVDMKTYTLNVKFTSKKTASGMWNYTSEVPTDSFTILGTKGRIEMNFFNNSEPLKIYTVDGMREEVVLDSKHVGLPMEQEIVNELLGNGHFSGTLEEALETLKITSKMYFS